MNTWILFFKYNRFLDSAIIIDGLFQSILKKKVISPGQPRRVSYSYGNWNNSWLLRL
jgi:hypothetical protein